LRRPAGLTDVQAFIARFPVKQNRVVRLFVREQLAARLTGMGAGLNIPLNHEDVVRHAKLTLAEIIADQPGTAIPFPLLSSRTWPPDLYRF